jgi:hypothetical protein
MTDTNGLLNASHNVAEQIRKTYDAYPAASNHEIKQVILERHGLQVGSNQIVQTIGSESKRKELIQKRELILKFARELADACKGDRLLAYNHLRMVC